MKNAYAVVAHRIDCGDETMFMIENECGKDWFDTIHEARKLMKEDYKRMSEDWDIGWTKNGEDVCKRKILKDEIFMDIPCANENGEDDWIHCHWKIVKM